MTVLWVLFGVPGVSATATREKDDVMVTGGELYSGDGRLSAKSRVLTGLMMGLMVFLMSGMGVGVWVGGSVRML